MRQAEADRLQRNVRQLTKELRNLLTTGYAVRVIADYRPDLKVQRREKTMMLSFSSIETAANWPQKAALFCGGLLGEWRQLGH